MQAFLASTIAVAVAEIGDKTQLLSLVLAARYKRPAPILAGIALATVLNHALAGAVGAQVASWLGPTALRWGLGIGFLVMAAWTLVIGPSGSTVTVWIQPAAAARPARALTRAAASRSLFI